MIARLIRKDLLLYRTLPLWIALSIAVNVVILVIEGDRSVSPLGFGAFIAGFLPVMICAGEERSRANAFACALPVRRRGIVLARHLLPLILSFGFMGLVAGLIALQVLALGVLIVGPRLGLRDGILAVEDVIRSIGPSLRGLRTSLGDPAFYLALFAALAALSALSYLVSCALYGRRDL